VVVDVGEDVGEPSAGVDVVQLGRLDQRVDGRSAAAAAIGTGEDRKRSNNRFWLAVSCCAIFTAWLTGN